MFEIFFQISANNEFLESFLIYHLRENCLFFQWFNFYTARLSEKPIHFATKVQKSLLKTIAKTKRKTNEFWQTENDKGH